MNVVSALARIAIASVAVFSTYRAIAVDNPQSWDKFTIQSNVIMALVFLWAGWALLAGRKLPPAWIEGAAVLYLVITGVIYNFVLQDDRVFPQILFGLTNSELHHVVTPIGAFAVWLLFAPHRGIKWRFTVIWLTYMVVYLAVFLTRGIVVDGAGFPYPFMDLELHGWRGLAENFALFFGAFAIMGAVIVAIDKVLPTRTILTGGRR